MLFNRQVVPEQQLSGWKMLQRDPLTRHAWVGTLVGDLVGLFVGVLVGLLVGILVGLLVGAVVGFLIGASVGSDGALVGTLVGELVAAGRKLFEHVPVIVASVMFVKSRRGSLPKVS
jgi:hypothetical protein